MKLTPQTLIPATAYIEALSENSVSYLEGDPLGRLLLHLHGGKRGIRKLKVPLKIVTEHLAEIELCGLPYGSANVTNKEWIAYCLLTAIRGNKKGTFDPKEVSAAFHIPEFSPGANPHIYDCVNGTLMLMAGYQITADHAYWLPEANCFPKEEDLTEETPTCTKIGWLPGYEEEPISAQEVAEALIGWNVGNIQNIVDRLNWNYDTSKVKDFNTVGNRLISIFNLRYETGASRNPVDEWDAAVMRGPSMVMLNGSGSNIRVQMSYRPPETPVKIAA